MSHLVLLLSRKIGFFLAVLAGVSFAIIAISRMVPGDAIDQISDSPEQRAQLEEQLGLNLTLTGQYLSWWGRVARLDFGESWVIRQGEPVSALILPAAGKTATLVIPALALNFALVAGLIAFFRYDGFPVLKRGLRSVSHAMSVIPLFLLGYLIILLFNAPVHALVERGLLTRPEWFALPAEETWHKYVLAIFVLAVGNGTLSDVLIHLEAEVAHLSGQEFMVSTRARGGSWIRHFLPNILVPTMTVLVNKTAFVLGGVVVAEYVFNINGLGMMIWNAANQRDVPVIVAISFLISGLVALLNLISDLVQVWVDPRLRQEHG